MITIILARFPLRSKVLGPRVVNFMRFWSRDVPLHPKNFLSIPEHSAKFYLALQYTRPNWSKN